MHATPNTSPVNDKSLNVDVRDIKFMPVHYTYTLTVHALAGSSYDWRRRQ